MKKIVLGTVLMAVPAFAANFIDQKIEIYTNSAYLVQKADIHNSNQIELTFDYKIRLPDLKLFLTPDKCSINSINEQKQNFSKLKKLENELTTKQNKIKSLKVELKFLENLKPDGNIQKLEDIGNRYFSLLEQISTLNKEIKSLKEKIIKLKSFSSFNLNLSCKNVSITSFVPVPVSAFQEYVIIGNTKENKIKIENNLYLKNGLDREFKNISLEYHSYKKTSAIGPPPFNFIPYKYSRKMIAESFSLPEKEYIKTETKSFFSVSNVDLPAKSETKINISTDTIPAKFEVFIDGYATVTPFLKAVFKTNKSFYPSSNSNFYIDGIYIGKWGVKFIEENKENQLFFGEDVFIDVSKIKIKDFEETSFLGKKIKTKKWKYILKNNHTHPVKVIIADKIPISTNEKLKIEPFSSLKWKKITPEGKILWEINLKPTEELNFEFGYKKVIKK